MSSTQKAFYDHLIPTNSSRGKHRLSKSERTRKSREMFCRKGSRILPDFFPPDTPTMKMLNGQTILPCKCTSMVKQYSWENEESGESEAQTIAESWMKYFGLEACNTWCWLETECKLFVFTSDFSFYWIQYWKLSTRGKMLFWCSITFLQKNLRK